MARPSTAAPIAVVPMTTPPSGLVRSLPMKLRSGAANTDVMAVFDDFCTWAGNGMELWTSQEYYTDTYYCKSDPCIHLLVQYTCGSPRVSSLDYWGCMGHFSFAIEPEDNCGGPPYPGARVESPDHCWIFQATADTFATSSAVSKVALECDDSGRWCHLPGSDNATLPVPEHEWGSTIRPSLP
ncbi:hypothetical protein LTR37_009013 [Vermiconidia calcicola]|uniref:Uncharacterized protein n=1 Tax=Vermiconidia calcicola TaxID=1690605 RepID=A0ACC3N9D5_9PEZI|nr:hypothetical protein LTR37_009013 [Vermiconidia calcicola]